MKRLERPIKGRVIAGVAAGLANYFNVNVILVRLVWVILFLPGGAPGLLPYLICWIVIPSEKKP
jgi:phage shock protein C